MCGFDDFSAIGILWWLSQMLAGWVAVYFGMRYERYRVREKRLEEVPRTEPFTMN